jgi:hypothetical protein
VDQIVYRCVMGDGLGPGCADQGPCRWGQGCEVEACFAEVRGGGKGGWGVGFREGVVAGGTVECLFFAGEGVGEGCGWEVWGWRGHCDGLGGCRVE